MRWVRHKQNGKRKRGPAICLECMVLSKQYIMKTPWRRAEAYVQNPLLSCHGSHLAKLYHSVQYSWAQKSMISSTTECDGSESKLLKAVWPSEVVAAWASSAMLWYASPRTFRACSGMGGQSVQYGSRSTAGFPLETEADFVLVDICCRILSTDFWKEVIEKSGNIGMSKRPRMLFAVNWGRYEWWGLFTLLVGSYSPTCHCFQVSSHSTER